MHTLSLYEQRKLQTLQNRVKLRKPPNEMQGFPPSVCQALVLESLQRHTLDATIIESMC